MIDNLLLFGFISLCIWAPHANGSTAEIAENRIGFHFLDLAIHARSRFVNFVSRLGICSTFVNSAVYYVRISKKLIDLILW